MRFHLLSHPIRNTNFFQLVLIVALLLVGILFVFIDPRKLDASDLMLIAWNPAHELLTTGSVYADYPYPLWTVIIMLPFTIWAPKTAMLLWFICNLFMLSASIVLLVRLFDWSISPISLVMLVFLCGFFLPVLTSIWLGQLTIFSLLMLALTAYFFRYRCWTWLGMVLGLSLIKPQVMVLLAGLLLLWALLERRWQVLIAFSMVIISLVLISLPFISSPNQIIGSGIGIHLLTYIQKTSTLWGLLLLLGFPWWVPLAIAIVLLVWLGYLWLPVLLGMVISPMRVNFLFSVTTIVNLIIVPYSWMHNLALLLLPLGHGLTLILKMKNGARFVWGTLLFVIMYPVMLAVFSLFSGPLNSQAYQVIPALLLLPMIYYLELREQSKQEG